MRRSNAADVELAARLLDQDDIDKIEDHDLSDSSSGEDRSRPASSSSSSSLSSSSSSSVMSRGRSRLSRPWLGYNASRWLTRRRAQPKSIALLVLAIIVLIIILCSPYTSTARVPLQGVMNLVYPSGNSQKYCTTWPVDEEGKLASGLDVAPERFKVGSVAPPGGWKKPQGFKVIGMVFYGRRRTVDILECYLQQNLAANGGYLDEVWFMSNTEIEDDVAWLDDLVGRNQEVYKVIRGNCPSKHFGCLWDHAVGNKTMYIKIDDDILYIHPDAIPQLVHTRLNVPHPFATASNLINSPVTAVQHYHYGAIYPFMPETSEKASFKAAVTWRPSAKPHYPDSIDSHPIRNVKKMPVPYQGHTWLMTTGGNFDLIKTPMGVYQLSGDHTDLAFSPAWESWGIGAQQQYSLLHNLEQNRIDRYFFGRNIEFQPGARTANADTIAQPIEGGPGGEQTYDTRFGRYNLNFVAVWGSDIREQLPIADDDEQDLTVTIPLRTQRPFLVDTRSVVSHFSFGTQMEGMRQTDLIDRYRALANEVACPAKSPRIPMDPACPGFEMGIGGEARVGT
ncbi:uncharacterized protein B0I36DRAFT_325697 [Microdochium trichocladiopsis]|uniref:Uncharacterized protein n=1 Tax=Microdochium trichocladiopsis TaxID=1682393 RepID=A0A9P8Y4A3_9PEZI|nr:uncharacterized protein B0I36DRAFT_325697 [Microdochium trichocladiopsis]KAH7029401.1 hypothetical protein B0I36DRAFT_325697 [Microdochium trichocladiopsis]